jgi:chloramphenicol-sensitive protein RarD
MNKKAFFAIMFTYIFWGSMPIFWKMMNMVNPLYTLAMRVIFSMCVSALFVLVTGTWKDVKAVFKNKRVFLLTTLAGILVCINWGLYIYASYSSQVTQGSLGCYLMPLGMILCGRAFFGEKLNIWEYVSTAFAAVGVIYMMISMGQFPTIALGMAVTFVIYGSIKKVTKLESNVSLTVETLAMLPFALAYVAFAEAGNFGAVGAVSGWQWVLLPLCGILTFIPLWFFGYGVTRIKYSIVGMLQYISPTIQLLLGVFVYGEAFTTMHLITFICIWLAVTFFLIGQQRHHKIDAAQAIVLKPGV